MWYFGMPHILYVCSYFLNGQRTIEYPFGAKRAFIKYYFRLAWWNCISWYSSIFVPFCSITIVFLSSFTEIMLFFRNDTMTAIEWDGKSDITLSNWNYCYLFAAIWVNKRHPPTLDRTKSLNDIVLITP